jgi:hypothetical protein
VRRIRWSAADGRRNGEDAAGERDVARLDGDARVLGEGLTIGSSE